MRAQPSTCRSRIGKASIILVLLLMAVPVVGVLGGLYLKDVQEVRSQTQAEQEKAGRLTGLGSPVVNRLDPRFTDADGDLVADLPADPKQLVDPDKIIFSYIAVEKAEEYAADWQPFIAHLSKVTGKPVEYDASLTDTTAQFKALKEGKLHVTGLNTGAVPKAVNACGFVPVVKLPTEDGTGMTRMRIITYASSPVRSPADLKGKDIAFTSPDSNSGFKAPVVLLRSDFGLNPGKDYTWRYTGGHVASIAGIKSRTSKTVGLDAAAVADDMLGRALASKAILPTDYRSIYESEKFPTAGMGYIYNLKPELAAKVAEAFRTFDWKGTSMEKSLGSSPTKFVPANFKNDWSLIRRIDDATGAKHGD